MRVPSQAAVFVVALAGVAAMADARPADSPCGSPYLGFDSRTSPEILGRLPASSSRVVGFEIQRGRPFVALEDRLVAFDGGKAVEVMLASPAKGLAIDADGTLWLRDAGGIARVGRSGPEAPMAAREGRIGNSGGAQFLRVIESGKRTSLLLQARTGQTWPLASFDRPLRAATWDTSGLTAVVGERVLIWPQGAAEMSILATDPAFAGARDICRLGTDHVVLTLDRHVVHLSQHAAQILVAGFPARCRFAGDRLVILDEQSGLLWSVAGIDRLGRRDADAKHARDLVAGRVATQPAALRVPEAARLVGCEAAGRSDGARPTPAIASGAAAPSGRSRAAEAGVLLSPVWLTAGTGSGLVLRVTAGSAAARAGLASGDKLISIAGRPIDGIDAADAVLSGIRASSAVAISVLRNGHKVTADLVLP